MIYAVKRFDPAGNLIETISPNELSRAHWSKLAIDINAPKRPLDDRHGNFRRGTNRYSYVIPVKQKRGVRFRAYFRRCGRVVHVGHFATELEAAQAVARVLRVTVESLRKETKNGDFQS